MSPLVLKRRVNAFTLVELIMVMVIVGILAGTGMFILGYLAQSAVYLPAQLDVDILAADALDIILYGDAQAGGLHTSRSIDLVRRNRVDFTDQNGQLVSIRRQAANNRLIRRINNGPAQPVPYYSPPEIMVQGLNNRIFQYYDANGTVTTDPAQVRRMDIRLTTFTGTGSFSDWEGSSTQQTGVAVFRLP